MLRQMLTLTSWPNQVVRMGYRAKALSKMNANKTRLLEAHRRRVNRFFPDLTKEGRNCPSDTCRLTTSEVRLDLILHC